MANQELTHNTRRENISPQILPFHREVVSDGADTFPYNNLSVSGRAVKGTK